MDKVKPIII